MAERAGVVTMKGNPMTLVGEEALVVGQPAPDFTLSKNLKEDTKLSDYKGKKVVLNIVPSLDTPVCSIQTARFNQEAANLGGEVVILTISVDLPVAQSRWCEANKVENVVCLSDFKHHEFAAKSGLLIKELGLFARAVYVLDQEGVVRYAQLVKEVASEPAYDDVLAAVKGI